MIDLFAIPQALHCTVSYHDVIDLLPYLEHMMSPLMRAFDPSGTREHPATGMVVKLGMMAVPHSEGTTVVSHKAS